MAEILNQIAGEASTVSQLIDGVSSATQEQSEGIDQLNVAVSEIDKVTQRNASNSEEMAAASEQLSTLARALKEYVRELAQVTGSLIEAQRLETN